MPGLVVHVAAYMDHGPGCIAGYKQVFLNWACEFYFRGYAGGGAGAAGGMDMSALLNAFGGMGGGLGGFPAPQPPADPETAYATQLAQLQDMGFFDRWVGWMGGSVAGLNWILAGGHASLLSLSSSPMLSNRWIQRF